MLARTMTILLAATLAGGLLAGDAQARGGGGGGGGGHGGGFGGGGHAGGFGGGRIGSFGGAHMSSNLGGTHQPVWANPHERRRRTRIPSLSQRRLRWRVGLFPLRPAVSSAMAVHLLLTSSRAAHAVARHHGASV
jgi:hypothetical protein